MEVIKNKHAGCYGIVYNDKNQVLLVRKANGAYKGKLDLPGGGIEYGETAEETLRREFLEEAGIEIDKFSLKTIITHYEIWQMAEDIKEDLEHYAIIYDVQISEDKFNKIKLDADGRDSLGACWYDVESLKRDDLSPVAQCIK